MANPNFVAANIPLNSDGSSLSQAQKNAFLQQQPAQLGQKHQTTIKNIKDLQEIEKYMFNNLQTLNKSSANSGQQADIIKQRINELSAMRLALFGQLKTMYTDQQLMTSNSRDTLTDQLTMTKVIENELDNAKKQLKVLEQERLNKKRLVELGDYEYDRYTSHKNLVKVVAYGALAILVIVIAMGQPWFPAMLGVGSIVLIITVVLITIVGRILRNWNRTELYWHKFQWKKGCYRTDSDGACLDSGKDRKSWDWSKMFRNTCDNIAAKAKDAKTALQKIANAGQARLTPGSGADAGAIADQSAKVNKESFVNIVTASQPKGSESFHSIF